MTIFRDITFLAAGPASESNRSAARGKGVRMEQVVGIGGVFFKARDPKALAAWYREHLGVPIEPEQTYGAFTSAAAGEQAVWSAFPADTSYFGSGPAPFMVNYRVRNLDAMLVQLQAAGAQVEERVEGRGSIRDKPAAVKFRPNSGRVESIRGRP